MSINHLIQKEKEIFARKQTRARQRAEMSSFDNSPLDMIAIMKSTLTADEWEEIIGLVFEAKDEDEAKAAIEDFYNECY